MFYNLCATYIHESKHNPKFLSMRVGLVTIFEPYKIQYWCTMKKALTYFVEIQNPVLQVAVNLLKYLQPFGIFSA